MMALSPRETFEQRARAIRDTTGWDIEAYAAERDWSAVGVGPVGQHRDSSARDRSNYAVVLSDLKAQFADAIDAPSFSDWGVGWVDEIAFDAGNEDVCDAVEAWEVALADYPIADDMHCSALEHEEGAETIRAITSTWATIDGVDYERLDDLPDDWAEQVLSHMWDAGQATTSEDMRGVNVDAAMIALGFYVPEVG